MYLHNCFGVFAALPSTSLSYNYRAVQEPLLFSLRYIGTHMYSNCWEFVTETDLKAYTYTANFLDISIIIQSVTIFGYEEYYLLGYYAM
jgi:hypothetical protein